MDVIINWIKVFSQNKAYDTPVYCCSCCVLLLEYCINLLLSNSLRALAYVRGSGRPVVYNYCSIHAQVNHLYKGQLGKKYFTIDAQKCAHNVEQTQSEPDDRG